MKGIRPASQIEKLKKEQALLLAELKRLREAVKSEIDIDIGEGDPEVAERETLSSLIQLRERKLQAINQALADLGQGTYGICERCGQPIDPQRLAVLPEATLCINCQRSVERRGIS